MRLDWFLPVLRKPKPDVPVRANSFPTRLARRVLPEALFSDPNIKKRGLLRRWLRTIGLSWLSSPVRRVCQTVCFVAFLWLFFVVCWPYGAQPSRSSTGWLPIEVDAESGRVLMESEEARAAPFLQLDSVVFITDDSQQEDLNGDFGAFRITTRDTQQLAAEPVDPLGIEQLDRLAFSLGPWSIHERRPGAWPTHYADNLAAKEKIAAETFLTIDPLLSLSTALAARSWVWSLTCAAIILAVCVLIPRGFCGYLCPLGTLIDLFDWSVGNRVQRFRISGDGWWVHIKYYLLLATLVAALCGVLISGYVAAIPVITRGLLFTIAPFQNGFLREWHLVPPLNWGHVVSLFLFFAVLALGLLRPRFWCKYVCPSGAVFSLGNLFRASERKVESTCIHCNKCVEVCPFDAIKPDFTTRTTDCTLCQTCGGVCPTHAIKFVDRFDVVDLKTINDPPTGETRIGRRGFLSAATGTAAAIAGGLGIAGVTNAFGAGLDDPNAIRPVRPPGSVPEQEFLQMCIRCGECFQACPNDVLHPMGFEQGFEGLWTPQVVADWAGCESGCNVCGQVCPTGAIRALPMEEKKVARMGLAIVNTETCLPFAGREACQLCVDECNAAGYEAIEFTQVHTEVDDFGLPVEGTGFLAPVVRADKCVGCGLCQTRCYGINQAEKNLLSESAIIIEAGAGKEDRMMQGSYIQLREFERAAQQKQQEQSGGADSYLPDFLE